MNGDIHGGEAGGIPRGPRVPGLVEATLCGVASEVRDAALAMLPVSVTGHLVEAHRHLGAAAVRVVEMQDEKAARVLARAREIHERLDAERAARRAAQASQG